MIGSEVITNDQDIVQTINDYFAPMFTDEDLQNVPAFETVIKDAELTSLECYPDEVSSYYLN